MLKNLHLTATEDLHVGRQSPGCAPDSVELASLRYKGAPALSRPGLIGNQTHPRPEPIQKIRWGQLRVEIGLEVVKGVEYRREHEVKARRPALGEIILLIKR